MSATRNETTGRVEFRWRQHEADFVARLEEAAQQSGRTISDQARELLKDALTMSERQEHNLHVLQQEVAQLRLQLRDLRPIKEGLRAVHTNIYLFRDDLATCVAKLLTDAGLLPPDVAEQWVKQTLGAE